MESLEIVEVDLLIDRHDGSEAEIEVEAVVEFDGAGEVSVLGSGRLHLPGVCFREVLRGDGVGVMLV